MKSETAVTTVTATCHNGSQSSCQKSDQCWLVQQQGYIDPATKEVRRIPFEIMVKGDKSPVYEENLEDNGRFNEEPVLPFNAFRKPGIGKIRIRKQFGVQPGLLAPQGTSCLSKHSQCAFHGPSPNQINCSSIEKQDCHIVVRRTISVGNHVVISFQVGLYNLLCISTLCYATKLPRRHV